MKVYWKELITGKEDNEIVEAYIYSGMTYEELGETYKSIRPMNKYDKTASFSTASVEDTKRMETDDRIRMLSPVINLEPYKMGED